MTILHPLHITKVAVGCSDVDVLRQRTEARTAAGEAPIRTRYRPTRHEELVGGSLFWIIKHQLVVRQRILGFGDAEDGHCLIRLDPELVAVRMQTKRAHQGWRYLAGGDAPVDLDGEAQDPEVMPPGLARALAALALL